MAAYKPETASFLQGLISSSDRPPEPGDPSGPAGANPSSHHSNLLSAVRRACQTGLDKSSPPPSSLALALAPVMSTPNSTVHSPRQSRPRTLPPDSASERSGMPLNPFTPYGHVLGGRLVLGIWNGKCGNHFVVMRNTLQTINYPKAYHETLRSTRMVITPSTISRPLGGSADVRHRGERT